MKRQEVIELDSVETTKKFNIDWKNVLVDGEAAELEMVGSDDKTPPFEPSLSGDDSAVWEKSLRDSEINDHLKRLRLILASSADRLPDKGDKVRSSIRDLQYEKQRRMLRPTKLTLHHDMASKSSAVTNVSNQSYGTQPTIEDQMATVVKRVGEVDRMVLKSPLYWESIELLAKDEYLRGIFYALPDECKLHFLKRKIRAANEKEDEPFYYPQSPS